MDEIINFILLLMPIIIVLISQIGIKQSYKKYSRIKTQNNLTGKEVAEKILYLNNIVDVRVLKTEGTLTDHFNPQNKTIKLSDGIYDSTSVAAVAVAAHESSHVLQHSEGYGPLLLRSRLVPVVNLSSRIGYFILIIGILLEFANLSLMGLLFMSSALVFQLVTLPVEFDASKRAIKILKEQGIIVKSEEKKVKRMLETASVTYIASFFATMLQMLRFLLIITGSKRRD